MPSKAFRRKPNRTQHQASKNPGTMKRLAQSLAMLGLFLVAGWVQALNGRISYDLAEYPSGRQSVSFRLWLPA